MSNESRLMNHSESGVLNIRNEGSKKLFSHPTHLVSALSSKLESALLGSGHLSSDECQQLFDEGVDCELLEVGSAWQSGKIRVCLQFVPAEEEILSEPSIDFSEPSIDLPEAPIDFSELSIDLPEAPIGLSEALIDLPEARIGSSEDTVELPLDEVWQSLEGAHMFNS